MLAAQLQTSVQCPQPAKAPLAYDADATRKLGALRSLGRKLDAQDPRLVREAAALLTSQLFFAPLLAEMRKLPFGKRLGHGGRMEEVFGEQLDLHIADAVARSDRGFTGQLAERLASSGRLQPARPSGPQWASWRAQLQAGMAIERSKD